MNAPALLDLSGAHGGLFAAALLLVAGALLWLIERCHDVRANRRDLRRRQIARQAPTRTPAELAARTGVKTSVGSYPDFDKVHARPEQRQ